MDIHVLNSYAKVTIKAVVGWHVRFLGIGRRLRFLGIGGHVRFLGIGRRVEVGEKFKRSQSHLKVLCTFIRILSIRPGAG